MVAAKSLQSCPTLCDLIDGSLPGSPIPGILQARRLEWVAISFSNPWKWKWSRSVVSHSSQPHRLQPTRLLCPWDFPGKSTGVGCHCLLQLLLLDYVLSSTRHSICIFYSPFLSKEKRYWYIYTFQFAHAKLRKSITCLSETYNLIINYNIVNYLSMLIQPIHSTLAWVHETKKINVHSELVWDI